MSWLAQPRPDQSCRGWRAEVLDVAAGCEAADTAVTRDIDHCRTDPVAAFWSNETLFREAVTSADLDTTVDHRAGRRPGGDLVTMRVMDLTLHTDDLCRGTGLEWKPSDGLARYLLTDGARIIDELRELGLFAPVVTTVGTEPLASRLLAFAGRTS